MQSAASWEASTVCSPDSLLCGRSIDSKWEQENQGKPCVAVGLRSRAPLKAGHAVP